MTMTKHFFIINPEAGKMDVSEKIINEIKEAFKGNSDEYKIYITKGKNDATNFTESVCKNETGNLRFYACGGDGTLNEVVNGLVGYKNASASVIPYGTGNDFVNNFSSCSNFIDIEKQIEFKEEEIDLLKVNNKYSVNLCNIGFDAKVAENMYKFKRFPLISGQGAYTLSVFYSLLHKMYSNLEIIIDNKGIIKGEFLLCVVANGMTYGGGYKGAPLAKINDGLIDICIFKKVSRIKLIKLINIFKRGEHLENEEMKDYFIYKKCRSIHIKSDKNFTVCIDGEILLEKDIEINLENKAINFLVPHKEIIC
ncbi:MULTISPECIES: diacylglycerol/lipid kinase family protein [unclassified Clostridium]|uniref:diacylglycerol/lipid kinase family protein n=1 Tax=unclassified Clostridium TaxID=2614128 RepID=UPI0025D77A55|nr:diacylglycerol kinase family protein [Clostridium sp.]MCI6691940.1 diacylglycerol kinase family lipid kinase [Clostridium sp.]MDY2632268.1 diacylglycerol kinase family lipid kinase [Clostridium sp.]MDY4253404.1 diacylglycerol kinase family lipid kinase [Clostridium sp.]MDY6228719.1 diacylglycerol kinase family lipid kinase [Clostridium sp.]